ncbi:MAG: methyltransferase domain-containing protein [Chloroflexota bacterium]
MIWAIGSVGLLVILTLWWLLVRTEGVYLGRGVVIWLYDLYAGRYDKIVQHEDVDEHLHLAIPLMTRLHPQTTPLVLDIATGTGRMPLALCQHARFEGYVVGLDASRGMLKQAVEKIEREHFVGYTTFMWGDGTALPFDDGSFDVVTCMEALEFMPQPERGLQEMVRVLRAGGLLLTTRRINEPFMPGKLWSRERMRELLSVEGIEQIEYEDWQYDYEKVWGVKVGESVFRGVDAVDGLLAKVETQVDEDGIVQVVGEKAH